MVKVQKKGQEEEIEASAKSFDWRAKNLFQILFAFSHKAKGHLAPELGNKGIFYPFYIPVRKL